MLELKKSQVEFIKEGHLYYLGDKRLQGITRRIRERVCPDEYEGIPQAKLDKAAERGHAIHESLELYINYKIESNTEEFKNFMTECQSNNELKNLIAAEYIVSDNTEYASAIDIVSQGDEENSVYLIDLKTTEKRNIPYVTWQLSIYRMFFEMLNPGIKVKGIFLLWLRKEKHLFQQLNMKSEDECKKLLYTDEPIDASVDDPNILDLSSDERLAYIEKKISNYSHMMQQAEESLDKCKKELLDILAEKNAVKFTGDKITAIVKSDSFVKSFDKKKFEKEHPEMVKNYTTTSVRKGSLSITLKKPNFKK